MAQQGLSLEDTNSILKKLRELRVKIVEDETTILNQRQEIRDKEQAFDTIVGKLKRIRKEILASGGALTSTEFRTSVAKYLRQVREEVDYIRQQRGAKTLVKTPLRVVITGAAGQIGYSLVPLFASGQVFGLDQPVILHLLEIPPAMKALEGVCMEIRDCAYPLVQELVPTTDPAVAFKDADYAILVGGFPRKKGMLRKDLLAKNLPIFKSMGQALQSHAKESCKVLVVANPANTNALVASSFAPKLSKKNFAALTRLDQNRASSQIASKLGVRVRDVRNVAIWGNHSATQVPDVSNLVVMREDEPTNPEFEEKYVAEFRERVQQRGKEVLEARGFSSAVSAANAVKDCLRDWVFGTPSGEQVAMAVYSDGSYGIEKGIFYSFPVTCGGGDYHIVQNLRISKEVQDLMKVSEEELVAERDESGIA